jgi:hypothetical protein
LRYRVKAAIGYSSLGKARLKAGSRSEALALFRKSEAILETSDHPAHLGQLACLLALASTVVDPAEGAASAERQRRDAERAMAMLRRAIGKGMANTSLFSDPDFDSLRSRPDFQALLLDLSFPADPFAPAE